MRERDGRSRRCHIQDLAQRGCIASPSLPKILLKQDPKRRLDVLDSRICVRSSSDAVMPEPIQLIRIVRDDGQPDAITRRHYSHYNEAYDELERFYAGLCCSDERIEYSIVDAARTASEQ